MEVGSPNLGFLVPGGTVVPKSQWLHFAFCILKTHVHAGRHHTVWTTNSEVENVVSGATELLRSCLCYHASKTEI